MTTTKKWNYVFGPVPSRRLGLSIGVDVIPKKVCTLDCVYCEVGATDKRALRRREYFPADSIISEIEDALKGRTGLEYITFSGSGEPTLNSKLGEIIRAVRQLSSIPIAVITNGTLFSLEEVRYDLTDAAVVLPSLDAASQDVFERIDRPHPQLRIESIIEGMECFREEYKGLIWLEIMLVKGFNDDQKELLRLQKAMERIRPDKVQLNTVIRPPSELGVERIAPSRLKEIQALFGERCEIIGLFDKHGSGESGKSNIAEILSLLERRAMTIEGLADSQKVDEETIVESLRALKEAGLIVSFLHHKEEYYRAKDSQEPEEVRLHSGSQPAK